MEKEEYIKKLEEDKGALIATLKLCRVLFKENEMKEMGNLITDVLNIIEE